MEVAEASRGRDGGQIVFTDPQQILALAAGVEAVLLQVSGSQEGAGVKILPRELNNLLGFDPAAVDELETLQMDNLERRQTTGRVKTTENQTERRHPRGQTDQDGWQPPKVQLFGGQPVGLALGAVVELILSQLLLTGESFQTAVQADGLSLGPAGLLHTAVLLHDLQGQHGGQ